MRYLCRHAGLMIAATTAAMLSAPAMAQEDMRDPDFEAEDLATQPLRDLNLHRDEIPPLLIDVAADPYAMGGLDSCAQISRAVTDLNLYLGADIDQPALEKSDMQKGTNMTGNVAKSLIGGLIPFRGVLREVTGANDERRRFERIIGAALIRRGFLKGMGAARSCEWPARPAQEGDVFDPVARRTLELEAAGETVAAETP